MVIHAFCLAIWHNRRMKHRSFSIVLFSVLMSLSACQKTDETPTLSPPSEQPSVPDVREPIDIKASIDLSLKPNEAGQVMILMYHNIDQEESTWTRTMDHFRQDLQTLYDLGYRPISLTDYVLGHIDIEAGMTPVVLTFDDGNLNNFRILDDGSIDPNSAVGMLLDFHQQYPDFPLEASFFITGAVPFRQRDWVEYKLNFLIEQGMDIGNHTLDHINFTKASAQDIQAQIGSQAQRLEGWLTDSSYQVNTLALTYGSRPSDKSLEIYLEEGMYETHSYRNIAILNVGSNPAKSPFVKGFNPLSLPRVRASLIDVAKTGLYDYLAYFEANPDQRFISDGVAEIITVPTALKDQLHETQTLEIYLYE